VLVALDAPAGNKTFSTFGVFADGATLKDHYSGQTVTVKDGKVNLDSPFSTVLLAAQK
jgi:alpha-amylase